MEPFGAIWGHLGPFGAIWTPQRFFALSLSGFVPVEQPSPQSNCWPESSEVKCVWSFVTNSLITYQVF